MRGQSMAKSVSRSRTRTSLFCSAAVIVSLAGCGGGGGSATSASTQLAFAVNWEQRLAEGSAAIAVSTAPDGAAVGFDTPIPPSVNAIRFLWRPAAPAPACCISVIRGTQAFTDRRLVLAGVTPGPGSLEVNGFPTNFAPSGGVGATCATSPPGGGSPCSGPANTLPSFGSDGIPVDVVPNQANIVDVDVHSLPFVIDLEPADGETVNTTTPDIDFTIVDANHAIAPGVNIRVRNLPVTVNPGVLTAEECVDGDAVLPDCSDGGELEVQGLRIHSEVDTPLPAGEAELRLRASNTAPVQRDMESNTVFNVLPPDTTTTTTTTTPSTSGTSTTTTLEEFPVTFCLKFSVSTAVDLVGISYEADYSAAAGEFTGTGENVACTNLLETNPNSTLATFNDNDGASALSAAFISAETFSGPVDLARCEFSKVPPLFLPGIAIEVTEATAPDLSPASATVIVEETACPLL
jgi:hypothetical protein